MDSRVKFLLISNLLGLAACSGSATSVGSIVGASNVPTTTGTTTTTAGGPTVTTGTPAPGTTGTSSTPTSSLVSSAGSTTYQTVSATQHFVNSLGTAGTGTLYSADQPKGVNSDVQVTYNPRDATYTVVIASTNAAVTDNARFQDPAHRTTSQSPLIPTISGNNYLESGSVTGTPPATTRTTTDFTYARITDPTGQQQTPAGVPTTYVTYAGYVRDVVANDGNGTITETVDRSVFVYGDNTRLSALPRSGTASYAGPLYANITSDREDGVITGTFTATADFGANTVNTNFQGTVASSTPINPAPNYASTIAANDTFSATGFARIATAGVTQSAASSFSGYITGANYNGQPIFIGTDGTSLEGSFYGPTAKEIGGAFRIIDKTPNRRFDIQGVFVGK